MNMNKMEVDLIEHGPLVRWAPQIGDMIFRDGGLFRWCGLVDGINGENVHIRKSGNPTLLMTGDYKNDIVNVSKIRHSRIGTYFVVSRGIYYV